jgi:hypothetical protein
MKKGFHPSLRTYEKIRNNFNENIRPQLWDQSSLTLMQKFRESLELLETSIKLTHSEWRCKHVKRLIIGYTGICGQSGLRSGSTSLNAFSKKSNEYSHDHFFGASDIGQIVHEEFLRRGANKLAIDEMVNLWLIENLHLWMTIRVTKREHSEITKSCRKLKYSIDEKCHMKHYSHVSDILINA